MRSSVPSIIGSGLILGLVLSCSAPPVRPTKSGSGDLRGSRNPPAIGSPTMGKGEPGEVGESGDPGEPRVPGEVMTGQASMPDALPSPDDRPVEKEVKYSLLFVSGGSEEIKVFKFDKKSGAATLLKSHAVPGVNATFLAVHPASKFVYGADEKGSQALMMSIDPATGEMKDLSKAATSGGPAHISVDPTGKFVFAADYAAGAVQSYSVGDQALSLKSKKTPGKNAHSGQLDISGQFLFVPCLGSGLIAQYSLDSSGTLSELTPATVDVGSKGPRHLAFHPNNKFAFLMNEYDGYVQALTFDGKTLKLNGAMVASTASPVAGNSGAEIQVHPNGKFLYSSNRGDDSIAIYKINDAGTVALLKTVKTGGKIPRHFAIDPSGAWMTVANQGTNSVTVFQIDAATGGLSSKSTAIDYNSAQYAEIFDFY